MTDERIEQVAQEVGLTAEQVQAVLQGLIASGVVGVDEQSGLLVDRHVAEGFSTAKQSILRRDVYAAAREAREKSQRLFEDQGLTSVALVLSRFLADFVENPEGMLELA